MKGVHIMKIECYGDKDGNPTCALDFSTGEVCIFYRTVSFGCKETCVFADDTGIYPRMMERRKDGKGTLIPLDECPIWNKFS